MSERSEFKKKNYDVKFVEFHVEKTIMIFSTEMNYIKNILVYTIDYNE